MAPSPAVGAGAEDGGGISNDVRSLFKAARKERGGGVGGSHVKKAKSKAKPQSRVTGEKLRGTEEVRYRHLILLFVCSLFDVSTYYPLYVHSLSPIAALFPAVNAATLAKRHVCTLV